MVEFGTFYRDAVRLLGEKAYSTFMVSLAHHPESGDVMEGTGGFRKIRVAIPGKGKSGGARVIYFYACGDTVFLYAIYAKNELATLSAAQKNALRAAATLLKEARQ